MNNRKNGFFDKGFIDFFTKSDGIVPSQKVEDRVARKDCSACGLYKGCNSPRMKVDGKGKKKILIIAEAPGEDEDLQGKPLVGKAGQLLDEALEEFGIDMREDCWMTNALICRPPKNRPPTNTELKCCSPNWKRAINELQPTFIWLFGDAALQTFYSGRLQNDNDEEKAVSIGNWTKMCVPDAEYNAWVLPQYHPSFILRNRGDNPEFYFKMNLKWAVSCLQREAPVFENIDKHIKLLYKAAEVEKLLNRVIKEKPPVIFDYETSGLEPYRGGHKIYVIGVALAGETVAYAFPLHYVHWTAPELKKISALWIVILNDPQIDKVAHNIKFEHTWGRHVLKTETINWYWDTMLVQHNIDVRRGTKGLKTQAFLRWGVPDYSKEIAPYMKVNKDGYNTLHKFPLEKELIYVAKDAYYERKLLEAQKLETRARRSFDTIRKIYIDGAIAFSHTEDNGIPINMTFYAKEKKEITKEVNRIEHELITSDEAMQFKRKYGRELNLTSTTDLPLLFYELLGFTPKRFTAKKQLPSVDADTLDGIDSPFARKLLRSRKLLKIRDTFIKQFETEVQEGSIIRPSFNLHVARSGRSSTTKPSFQNIPVRDEYAKKAIRSGVVPSLGYEIGEADYKAIEVRIMACYTHDPVLINYIEDETTDMHRDEACNIFMVKPNLVSKPMRHIGKNSFVFPQFYGDWYKSCAKSIWEECQEINMTDSTPVIEHLHDKRIHSLEDMEKHIKDVEYNFWRKLDVSKEWRDDIVDFYRRHGYVETFFGFRRTDFLRRNQCYNTPIQGTAFHLLLWAYSRVMELSIKEGWKTRLIGQIHDSILADVFPKEKEYVKNVLRTIMCDLTRQTFKWIIVPLEIDFGFTGVNKSWANKI